MSDTKIEVGLRVETRFLRSAKMKPPTTKENTTKQPETTSPGIISAKVKIMEVRKGKRRKKRSIMVKLTLMGGLGVSPDGQPDHKKTSFFTTPLKYIYEKIFSGLLTKCRLTLN